MLKHLIIILSLNFTAFTGFGKGVEIDTFLVKKESEINEQLEKLRSVRLSHEQKLENDALCSLLESVLPHPGVMDYPFSSFRTMSTVQSPDGEFRLFNWNVEDENGINSHYCYMVLPTRGNKPNEVIEFKEDKITIPPRPENTLTPRNWYGALYYNIIPVKQGNRTYYTVIGYNGGSRSTNKKILDVFYFKRKKLRMGYPIFQAEKGSSKMLRRVFFEYSEKVTIKVNMDEKLEAIVFDHLVPETPSLEGMYDFYVPDMTYDGYRWQGEMWRYDEDLIATNRANKKSRLYDPNAENGDKEYIEVKDVWLDPVDGNPLGGGTSAVAPVEETDSNKKGKKAKSTKKRKKRSIRLFKRKVKQPRSSFKN